MTLEDVLPLLNTAMHRGWRYLTAHHIPTRRIPRFIVCYYSTESPVPSTSAVTLDHPQPYSLNDDPRDLSSAVETPYEVDESLGSAAAIEDKPSRGKGAKIRPPRYGSNHPTADLSTSDFKSFSSADIKFERPVNHASKAKIARLSHDLHKVLHNPGQIHRMKDPRSKGDVFNFDKRISNIPTPDEMNMPALSVFTKPSDDAVLVRWPS